MSFGSLLQWIILQLGKKILIKPIHKKLSGALSVIIFLSILFISLKFKKNSSLLRKLKEIFSSFKKTGYCKIEKFYTKNEIEYLQNLLLKDCSIYQKIKKNLRLF